MTTKAEYIESVVHQSGYSLIAFKTDRPEARNTLISVRKTLENVIAEIGRATVAVDLAETIPAADTDNGGGGTRTPITPRPIKPDTDFADMKTQIDAL